MKCSSCSNPAYAVAGPNRQPLCADHLVAVMTVVNEQQRQSLAHMNALRAQIAWTMGVPIPEETMVKIPRPINSNPVTYNNIRVNKSVVGSINTAQIGRIDVALDNISIESGTDVKLALKRLTEAVANSIDLQQETRDELIESLTFLAEQASIPPQSRQPKLIGVVLKSFASTISVSDGLTSLWDKFGPVIANYFK